VKLHHLVLGLTLIGAGTAVSLAADSAPATGSAPATTTAPATTGAPADAGTPATPATPAAPASGETPAATQPDPNEKICKKDEMTGSRLAKICKTRKEWEEEAKGGGSDF